MDTHWVELNVGDGTTMLAYVAEPEKPARAGVIVIQEIFGVNEPMRKLTELVASAGYLAISPAIFHRTDPKFEAAYDGPGFAKGLAAAGALTLESATADLGASSAYLHERLGPGAKLGTFGFCFGGSMAFLSATLSDFSCAVSFYGGQIAHSPVPSRPAMISLAPALAVPIFFAFGGQDQHIPAADHDLIRGALDAAGKTYEFHVYPNEDHGFFRNGPEANPGAREVWPLVQSFLAKNLA